MWIDMLAYCASRWLRACDSHGGEPSVSGADLGAAVQTDFIQSHTRGIEQVRLPVGTT